MEKEEELRKAKIEDEADKIEALVNSSGWQLIVEEIKKRYRGYLKGLTTCKEEDLKGIQARIREDELILEIPKDFLTAKKGLKENE